MCNFFGENCKVHETQREMDIIYSTGIFDMYTLPIIVTFINAFAIVGRFVSDFNRLQNKIGKHSRSLETRNVTEQLTHEKPVRSHITQKRLMRLTYCIFVKLPPPPCYKTIYRVTTANVILCYSKALREYDLRVSVDAVSRHPLVHMLA